MKRKLLQQINDLSILILNDKELILLNKHLKAEEFNLARLLLDDILVIIETQIDRQEFLEVDNSSLISKYEKIDKLFDLVVELVIVNDRERCRGKQVRETA